MRARTWQLPLCVRYGTPDGGERSQCTLLTEATGEMPLDGGCPSWVMPNADAAGYFVWSLPGSALKQLTSEGFAHLTTRERMSLTRSLRAGLDAGTIEAADALATLPTLTTASARPVVEAPMGILGFMHDHVVAPELRPAVQAYGRQLYTPLRKQLGFTPRAGEDGETRLLRASVLHFLADDAEDPAVRKRLAKLGRAYLGDTKLRPDAVPKDLTDVAARVALQDGDDKLFDRAYQHLLTTDDPAVRGTLLAALASVRDARSQRALALTLDPELRVNEVTRPLYYQMRDRRTRDAAWGWFAQHFDQVAERISNRAMGHTTHLAVPFCSRAQGEALRALFDGRIADMDGGPRNLAKDLESLALCEARASRQRESATAYFQKL